MEYGQTYNCVHKRRYLSKKSWYTFAIDVNLKLSKWTSEYKKITVKIGVNTLFGPDGLDLALVPPRVNSGQQ